MAQILDLHSQEVMDAMIDRYLRNQMTAEEETEFEVALRTDTALRERARFIAQTIKAMKEAEEGMMPVNNSGYRMVAKNPLANKKKK